MLFVTQFYLRSTRLKFTIKLALSKTTSTGIPIAYNLQSNLLIAKLLQLAYILPRKFTIKLALCNTATSTGIQIARAVALCLQLQLAYKLPAICNPLLFAYNFNCRWNACNLHFLGSLSASTTIIQKPAICNLPALCLQLLRENCPQICNPFPLCLRLLFRNSNLGIASASCTMPSTGELCHFSDLMRTLSCHHLHLVRKTCTNLNGVHVLWSSTSVWECHFDYIYWNASNHLVGVASQLCERDEHYTDFL